MNVSVVGDVILDEYTRTRKLGVSAETPTLVGEFESKESFLGGAGLVARHMTRLGANVRLFPMCPFEQQILHQDLSDDERDRLGVVPSENSEWILTQKRRFYCDDYKVFQIDTINKTRHTEGTRDWLLGWLRMYNDDRLFQDGLGYRTDAIVVCDNGHGAVDEEVMKRLVNTFDGKVYVDCQLSQNRDYGRMLWAARGAHMIFMNQKEFGEAVRYFAGGLPSAPAQLETALAGHLHSNILLKRGENGFSFFGIDGYRADYPGVSVKAVDTCGAGDALLAAIAAGRDMVFANRWAALSTTYRGTVVPQFVDLERL